MADEIIFFPHMLLRWGHGSATSKDHLGDHAEILGILAYDYIIIVWLVLTSGEILHSVDSKVLMDLQMTVGIENRGHGLS